MNIKKLSISLVLLFFNLSCVEKTKVQSADKLLVDSVKLPEGCQDSVCRLKVQGYPQEVAVLVPPYADYKHVTIYFQDFSSGQSTDHDLKSVMKSLDMIKSFKESQTDRILVYPFSFGQNKDYRTHFKNQADLKAFMNQVYQVLGVKIIPEDFYLIGHGGAYLTLQNMIEKNDLQISQVTLIDARGPRFKPQIWTKWLRSQDHKMTLIYLKNSSSQEIATRLWNRFSSQKIGKEGGINLDKGDYLTIIPDSEIKKSPDATWQLVKKWFGRVL